MTRTWLGVALWSLLSACNLDDKGEETAPPETGEPDLDQDGDGYLTDEDCNDEDATINPGVYETCNGVDDDCDGEIDDGIATTWYADKDGDGFGDPEDTAESCFKPDGYVPIGTDCDDTVADIYPGRAELCDGLDNDCDGDIDEDATNGEETASWYRDDDEDGYGDPDTELTACGTPEGYVEDSSDCDDDDEETYPGADELCDDEDDDCDGEIDNDPVDPGTWYTDADGDDYGDPDTETVSCDQPAGTVEDGTDCDDTHDDSHPTADEVCDERDNDCDGSIDEDAVDAETWYDDGDDDGYGDADDATTSCEAPDGSVSTSSDCDDTDSGVHPGATEYCDGEDDDCDGSIDESATDMSTWYADDDDDGYGDGDSATTACDAPSGYVDDDTDCDDTDSGVHPGATEYCDDEDDDCDGSIDESAVDMTTWYKDSDSDAYGDSTKKKTACDMPTGYVTDKTDCDDTDSGVHPGATEYCDDEDDDCDGSIDEDAVDATTWYKDADSDTWGGTTTTTSCDAPSGYVSRGSDCDETDSGVYPGATEYCDGEDDDCDGTIDEDAVDIETWYADDDDDGYGDEDSATTACDAPSGYVDDDTDCDDTDSGVHPGASEYCDDEDDDCDGSIDEGAVDRSTWYKDSDGDDYGDSSSSKKACDEPSGYTSNKTDCDDTDSGVHPGATEYCDDEDDDCDGSIDESAVDMTTWYKDSDSDTYGGTTSTTACDAPTGYVSRNSDCDDTDSGVYPGATEYCDDEDDDCDGSIDESAVDMTTWYKDNDSDTYGGTTSTTACDKPTGYVSRNSDCDDTDSGVYPGATEYCDDEDDDCDGSIDESAVDMTTWYRDADSDTYGGTTTSTACDMPTGYVSRTSDCDDTDSGVYPGATEYCDDEDDDCDGSIDEGAVDMTTWYKDADSDSYGGSTSSTACDMPSGYTASSSDCDDSLSSVYPGAIEVCEDGVDQDCDGEDAGCALSGDVNLSLSEAKLIGEDNYDYAARSIASAGDTNGDSYDDIIVGAYRADSYVGMSYIVLGPVSGDLDLYYADGKLSGESSSDYSGSAVAPAGDVDGDGYDDVLVGAQGEDSAGTAAGAAYLVSGPIAGSVGLSTAEARRTGTNTNDTAGFALIGGLDLDLDGYDDLLLSAYQDDSGGTSAGSVFVCMGPVTGRASLSTCEGEVVGETGSDFAGYSVDTADDVDGDGIPDFIVGAYGQDSGASTAGAAYLVVGPVSGTFDLSSAEARRTGITTNDAAGGGSGGPGNGVGGPGDVDGDGYADLLVGAFNYDVGTYGNAGAAWLLYGPITGNASLSTADAVFQGEMSDDRAGVSVSGASDVDSDGLADFLIGAYREDTGGTDAGGAYLFVGGTYSGTYSLSTADALFYGEIAGDYVGWDTSPGGDVNGDGYGDMLFGAWKQDAGATDGGAGYLVLGGVM